MSRRLIFTGGVQADVTNRYTPGSGVGARSRAVRRSLVRRAAGNSTCCPGRKPDYIILHWLKKLDPKPPPSPPPPGGRVFKNSVDFFNELYKVLNAGHANSPLFPAFVVGKVTVNGTQNWASPQDNSGFDPETFKNYEDIHKELARLLLSNEKEIQKQLNNIIKSPFDFLYNPEWVNPSPGVSNPRPTGWSGSSGNTWNGKVSDGSYYNWGLTLLNRSLAKPESCQTWLKGFPCQSPIKIVAADTFCSKTCPANYGAWIVIPPNSDWSILNN